MKATCPSCGTENHVPGYVVMDALAGVCDFYVVCDWCSEDVPFLPPEDAIVCTDDGCEVPK